MTQKILFIKNTAGGLPAFFPKLSGLQFDIFQQYEIDRLNFEDYAMITISNHSDQYHLASLQQKFETYLQAGGTIFFNGHIETPFLSDFKPFVPLPKRGKEELQVSLAQDHPAFTDVTNEMLSYRKGVAGFYGRGMNPPPEGAEILTLIGPEDWPLDWIYHPPQGGRIFCHAGNEIWGFLMIGAPENLPLVQQFFDWLVQTSPINQNKGCA